MKQWVCFFICSFLFSYSYASDIVVNVDPNLVLLDTTYNALDLIPKSKRKFLKEYVVE